MEIVIVTFVDSTTHDFWADKEEVAKTECKVCVAVGMLVIKNNWIIKLAMLSSKAEQGHAEAYSNWVDIPLPSVLAYEVVRKGKEGSNG